MFGSVFCAGPLLDTSLHFCYNKVVLIKIKNEISFNMAPTGNQILLERCAP